MSAVLCFFLLKVPLKNLKSGWIPISLFLFFTFISNVINQHGKILFSTGAVVITEEGLLIAEIRTIRVLFMIAGAKILIAYTKTDDMVRALGRLLSPFERLGLPVKDFFYTMGLTLKCFPILKDRASETYKENMKSGNIKGLLNRAKMISTFLMPMFVKSIQSPEVFFDKTEINGK